MNEKMDEDHEKFMFLSHFFHPPLDESFVSTRRRGTTKNSTEDKKSDVIRMTSSTIRCSKRRSFSSFDIAVFIYFTSSGSICQISSAYCLIVRSLEKNPDFAMLTRHIRAHPALS